MRFSLRGRTLKLVVVAIGILTLVSFLVAIAALHGARPLQTPTAVVPPTPTPTPKPMSPRAAEAASMPELEVIGRMIVYTAMLSIEVENVTAAVDGIKGMAEEFGGYVAASRVYTRGGRTYASITIRVPQDRFFEAIDRIKALGRLLSERVEALDVTEHYIDLSARLRSLRALESRLMELLNRALTVEDVLKVESELSRVRAEIEKITGEMKYIERRVEMSTISVEISEAVEKPVPPIIPEVDWLEPVRVGLRFIVTIIQGLIVLVIGLSPIAAIAAPIYYAYRRTKSKKEEATS